MVNRNTRRYLGCPENHPSRGDFSSKPLRKCKRDGGGEESGKSKRTSGDTAPSVRAWTVRLERARARVSTSCATCVSGGQRRGGNAPSTRQPWNGTFCRVAWRAGDGRATADGRRGCPNLRLSGISRVGNTTPLSRAKRPGIQIRPLIGRRSDHAREGDAERIWPGELLARPGEDPARGRAPAINACARSLWTLQTPPRAFAPRWLATAP